MTRRSTSRGEIFRHSLVVLLGTGVAWGLTSWLWYLVYPWASPGAALPFVLTYLVVPLPFLVHRALTGSRRTVEPSARSRPSLSARRLTAILMALSFVAVILPQSLTFLYLRPRLFSIETAPQKQVAIVFGAGLRPDGSPSLALQDRVATAADLYLSGKVQTLLLSGDNRFVNYNEPQAMKDYALSLGVPAQAIVLDYAGRRTYDTCYRAREIFGLQEAILVTRDYHLARAIYTCNALGVNAIGVPAAWRFSGRGLGLLYMNVRELPATLSALWEVHVSHPLPVLGEPEPILPSPTQSE